MAAMNGFALEQQASEHYRDLVALAAAGHEVRRLAQHRWRRALGQVLVNVGVGVGVPRPRRAPALRQARSLLCQDC